LVSLPIWGVLVLFINQKTNLELKFGGDGLLIDLQLLIEGILKINNFMLYGSLQKWDFVGIWKHVKYYFGGSFGEWSSI